MVSSIRGTVLLCAGLLVVACAPISRTPVPEDLVDQAVVPGIPPDARNFADEPSPYLEEWLAASEAEIRERYGGIMDREHAYLAISGGGSNGAFGAGLLTGWTEVGTRPEFTVVAGISTGALIAPFALLGPDYDHFLRELYTEYDTEALIKRRGIFKSLRLDAMADTEPLRELISSYVDQPLVDSLIRTQGLGDMYRMYLAAVRDGLDYHLAYEMAKNGNPWELAPPGL